MENQNMTEYERRRLENIRRNAEMIASLNIQSKAYEISASAKRHRVQAKTYNNSPEKKPKSETPITLRRSLRARGIPPVYTDPKGLGIDLDSTPIVSRSPSPENPTPLTLGPLSMRDAYRGNHSNPPFVEQIGMLNSSYSSDDVNTSQESIDLRSLSLKNENIARVLSGRIMCLRFFPTPDMAMIVAGSKFGDVSFWNMNDVGKGDGIYLYHPHSAPVSGILMDSRCLTRVFTSCYFGFIRLMDVEKEVFDLMYSSDDPIFAISHDPKNENCMFFSEGKGGMTHWDLRAGKASSSWVLQDDRVNTIDFKVDNHDIMATSSTDKTSCIWDIRQMNANNPKPLKTIKHKRAVHSAYFSPSGKFLATTSIDNTVALLSGDDYGDMCMIPHDNKTGRWLSSFRGIWGWDDEHIFIGNMRKGVDVISSTHKNVIMTIQSPLMSAIPCRFATHPYHPGMLAGATGGGQVYMWTS